MSSIRVSRSYIEWIQTVYLDSFGRELILMLSTLGDFNSNSIVSNGIKTLLLNTMIL